jgi:hypothetical protein
MGLGRDDPLGAPSSPRRMCGFLNRVNYKIFSPWLGYVVVWRRDGEGRFHGGWPADIRQRPGRT